MFTPRPLRTLALMLAVAALGSAPVDAQPAAPTEVTIRPALRTGDEFHLELVRIRENSARPDQDARATTPVTVKAIAVAPEGSTLEWTPGLATLSNPKLGADPLLSAAEKAIGGLSLRLRLNGDGEIERLENAVEVAATLQKATKIVVDGLMATLPAEQRAQFQALLSQTMSPAALLGSAMRDAQTYFGLNGIALEVGGQFAAKLEQPSPLGGVIPAMFEVRLQSATADTAVLATTTTYDGEALLQMTKTLLERAGAPVPGELAQVSLRMSDSGRFVFDRASGLMREVIVDRRVEAPGMKQRDGWEIRLIKVPAR